MSNDLGDSQMEPKESKLTTAEKNAEKVEVIKSVINVVQAKILQFQATPSETVSFADEYAALEELK